MPRDGSAAYNKLLNYLNEVHKCETPFLFGTSWDELHGFITELVDFVCAILEGEYCREKINEPPLGDTVTEYRNKIGWQLERLAQIADVSAGLFDCRSSTSAKNKLERQIKSVHSKKVAPKKKKQISKGSSNTGRSKRTRPRDGKRCRVTSRR